MVCSRILSNTITSSCGKQTFPGLRSHSRSLTHVATWGEKRAKAAPWGRRQTVQTARRSGGCGPSWWCLCTSLGSPPLCQPGTDSRPQSPFTQINCHQVSSKYLKKRENTTQRGTYISGKLLERVEHVEAMEVYDASRQCVIMSDRQSRMSQTQFGDHSNSIQRYRIHFILDNKFSPIGFGISDKTKGKKFSGIQAKSGPNVEYESSALSPVSGLCARVQAFRLGWSVS